MFGEEFEKTALSGDTLLRAILKTGKMPPEYLKELLHGLPNVNLMDPGRSWARELITKNKVRTATRLYEQAQATMGASEVLMQSMV